MGSQGFRNIAGNPFVYQEDTRSAAFGLDAAAQKWKLSVKATAGALPTDTPQLMIDPATNGDVTIDPNGSGNFVVTSGNVSLTSGNLALPTSTSTVGQVTINGSRFLHAIGSQYNTYAGYLAGNTANGGAYNTFFGEECALALTSVSGVNWEGKYNCGMGAQIMVNATTAQFNTGVATNTLQSLTSGYFNSAFGPYTVAYRLTTGNYNTFLGISDVQIASDIRYWGAGYNYTGSESSNICIGNAGTTGESNKIRIGSSGSGVGQQNATYIAGIYSTTVGATNGLVQVDNSHKLGATNSPSVTGSVTAGTDLISTAGHLSLPATSYQFTQGVVKIGGYKAVHMLGGNTNIWVGDEVANSRGTGFYQTCTYNTGVGYSALGEIWVSSSYNTAIGANALATAGDPSGSESITGNTCVGYNSMGGTNGSNSYNTCIGYNTLAGNVPSNYAVAIGYNAGSSVGASGSQGNSCIYILNAGGNENNKIRIGTQGTGNGQQDACYIAGIYGVTPGGTKNVALIDSNGQLGSAATLDPAYGGAMPWTEVTGTSQAAAVNYGYITNNAGLVTVTLPSTAAVGQRVSIVGKGAGLWKLAQNSGQTIHFGSIDSTTGTGGYLAATVRYDSVEVICITANTDWVVRSSVGSITIV